MLNKFKTRKKASEIGGSEYKHPSFVIYTIKTQMN